MTDTLTAPRTSAQLLEDLNDPAKLKAISENPATMVQYVGEYARAFNREDPEFQRQVDAQAKEAVTAVLNGERANISQRAQEDVQRELAHQLRNTEAGKQVHRLNLSDSRAKALHGPVGGAGWGARNALFNDNAPGAHLEDAGFEGIADYLRTIWHNADRLPGDVAARAQKLAAVRKVQNDYSSQIPADGGFLIPETLRSEVMMIALEQGITRPRARVIPMESLTVPIPAVDSTSNATSVFGGIVCYWTEEGAPLTESQALFKRVVLTAKKLTAYAEVPNELVQDASAFAAFFNQVYPAAMAWYEDQAFINGTGVGEPLGWMNAAAAVEVAAEGAQPADTIVWENIARMYSRMLPSSLASAVWVASIDTFPELATMALSVGTGGSAVWINNGAEGPPVTILGRPVIFTEKTPLLGDAGDISFVDLGYYLIGDRQVMQAESSGHYKFGNDLTAFRFIERVDGRPWLSSAITPANSGSTLSPFVKIAARA